MDGQMMAYPLTLTPLLERAHQVFAQVEIVSRRPNRSIVRATYATFTGGRSRSRKDCSARGCGVATAWPR